MRSSSDCEWTSFQNMMGFQMTHDWPRDRCNMSLESLILILIPIDMSNNGIDPFRGAEDLEDTHVHLCVMEIMAIV